MRVSRMRTAVFCALWLFVSVGRASTDPSPASRGANDWHFSLREDVTRIFSARGLIVLGTGAALSAGALAIEDPAAQARALDGLHDVPDVGNVYGSPVVVVGGAATLALFGKLTHRPTFTTAGVDLARSFAYSATLVGAMKVTFDRTRPDGERFSFPSGHAAAAFSTAPVLTHHFGKLAGAAAYALAGATALGRMEDRKHYLSDVVFGAALGFAVGDAIAGQRRGAGPRVLIDGDRVGVQVEF